MLAGAAVGCRPLVRLGLVSTLESRAVECAVFVSLTLPDFVVEQSSGAQGANGWLRFLCGGDFLCGRHGRFLSVSTGTIAGLVETGRPPTWADYKGLHGLLERAAPCNLPRSAAGFTARLAMGSRVIVGKRASQRRINR